MKKLYKIYDVIKSIDTANELKKHKITLSDYRLIQVIFIELLKHKKSETITKSVMMFYRENGFKISMSDDKISYIIS